MLLYLANAAKDKFGVFSVRKLVDIWMLLRSGRPIDWAVGTAFRGTSVGLRVYVCHRAHSEARF
jgi:hypothetical protein